MNDTYSQTLRMGHISVKSAYYKDEYDFGPSAVHMYPILGQVPPLPPGIITKQHFRVSDSELYCRCEGIVIISSMLWSKPSPFCWVAICN